MYFPSLIFLSSNSTLNMNRRVHKGACLKLPKKRSKIQSAKLPLNIRTAIFE